MASLFNIHQPTLVPSQVGRSRWIKQWPTTYERNRIVQQNLHSGRSWDVSDVLPVEYERNKMRIFDRDNSNHPSAMAVKNEVMGSRLFTNYVPVASADRVIYGDNTDAVLLYRSNRKRPRNSWWF